MLDQHLYWLHQISPDVHHVVGDKALYLGLASQHGYPVIPGFVVSADVFTEFLAQIHWIEPFLADFPNSSLHLNVNQPKQLQAITQQLQQAIRTTQFPPEWADAIETVCQSLPSAYLICRPSIAVEGHHDPSLSVRMRGLLSSRVCRKDAGAIAQAIQQVWADLFSARSVFVWQRAGIQLQRVRLGILVQPMYEALASGTLRQCENGLGVEACWGLGMAMNQGIVVPDRYLVDDRSGNVIARRLGRKSYAYSLAGIPPTDLWSSMEVDAASPDTSGCCEHLHLHSVAVGCQDRAIISEAALEEYADLSQSLSADLDVPVSLEWALGSSPLPGEPTAFRYGWLEDDTQWVYITQVLPQLTVAPAILTDQRFTDSIPTGQPTGEIPDEGRGVQRPLERLADDNGGEKEDVLDVLGDRPFLHPIRQQPHPHSQPGQRPSKTSLGTSSEISVANPVLSALGASSGQVVAPAWVVSDTALQSVTQLPTGYVLVAGDITPDWLLDIKRAVALVSERGGMTCHAAILARELGIPAVVGANDVTQLIHTGDMVLINGDRGTIHRVEPGHRAEPERDIPQHPVSPRPLPEVPESASPQDTRSEASPRSNSAMPHPAAISNGGTSPEATTGESTPESSTSPLQTTRRVLQRLTEGDRPNATQLMVSLSQPEGLEQLRPLPIDGIGLLRSELLLPTVLDPQTFREWMTAGNEQTLNPDRVIQRSHRLCEQLRPFLEAVYPAPVYYRSHDLRPHEFATLVGTASNDDPEHRHAVNAPESNPVLGLHGTLSYLRHPALFSLELRALNHLRHSGYDNLHLILPFVRTVEEFIACQQQIQQANLMQFPDFQVWIMAEVPSVLFLLPEYVDAGISGIAIGTNDLAQFILAVDRNQPALSDAYNQRHPAVLRAIHQLITAAQQHNLPCSICGEAPGRYPDLVKQFVEWGVTSISVSPHGVEQTYRAIAQAEKDLILRAIRYI